ncbi:hypothetical protein EsDP_00003319 [Epichloe bromicola]|uniref:BZIP domain-containing protein n=1 Tax=Epichloe bromicola TaxID=79588 RepID=A0ABQ0CNG2_9HYPO
MNRDTNRLKKRITKVSAAPSHTPAQSAQPASLPSSNLGTKPKTKTKTKTKAKAKAKAKTTSPTPQHHRDDQKVATEMRRLAFRLRAQNRASQRAYRERKERRIRHLESLLQEAALREQTLTSACLALQAENERLRDGHDDASSGRVPAPPVPGISDNTALLPTQLDPALMQDQAVETGEFNLVPNLYDYSNPHAAYRLSWCSRT